MEILIAIQIFVVITTGVVFCIVNAYKKKLEAFVKSGSKALQSLKQINSRHSFLHIPCFDMAHEYDNENYYNTISPEDYLLYHLGRKQKAVKKAITDASINREKLIAYQAEVSSICVLGNIEDNSNVDSRSPLDKLLRKYWLSKGFNKVCAVEKMLFDKEMLKPVTELEIEVDIYLTNIQGRQLTYKSIVFDASYILKAIARLQEREHGIYLDRNLWQAICRVERGKVSNRMRFAVYNRDGNRCRRCGNTYDLEVDHIYPISKGGKTTFDNLQTLCHKCNSQKSNIIEPSAVTPRYMQNHSGRMCPNCRITLVKRCGPYGEFWGCPNYPRCRYTAK